MAALQQFDVGGKKVWATTPAQASAVAGVKTPTPGASAPTPTVTTPAGFGAPTTPQGGNSQTPITAGATTPPTGGTLTATLTKPPDTTVPAPAVITSKQAETQLATIREQIEKLTKDVANHKAAIGATQPQATTPTGDNPQPKSLDDQIGDLLGSLSSTSDAINQSAGEDVSPLAVQQGEVQAQYDAQAAVALKRLDQIATGTYPLSPAEQSLLDSTKQTYLSTIQAQQTANDAYTGQMREAMASLGISTSAPTQAIGMIHAAISAGSDKVAELDAKMATELATLQIGFQKEDYAEVSDAWSKAADYMSDRVKTLQDMQKQIFDQAKEQKAELRSNVELALTTIINSAKFDYQQKQDAIDNAFKAAQIDETQRHNLQLEAVSRHEAGMDGGGTGAGGGTFTTAQINNGAAAAGVPIETFKTWGADAKNVFINGDPDGTKKTIDEALSQGTLDQVKSALAEMSLPAEAEAYFTKYAEDQSKKTSLPTPEERQSAFVDTITDLKSQDYTFAEARKAVTDSWTDGGKTPLTGADKKLLDAALNDVYGGVLSRPFKPGSF